MTTYVGIDLGTTNSAICSFDGQDVALYKSPEMATIYKKWFQSAIPPRGLNLDVPLSKALDGQFKKPSDSGDPAAYGS